MINVSQSKNLDKNCEPETILTFGKLIYFNILRIFATEKNAITYICKKRLGFLHFFMAFFV